MRNPFHVAARILKSADVDQHALSKMYFGWRDIQGFNWSNGNWKTLCCFGERMRGGSRVSARLLDLMVVSRDGRVRLWRPLEISSFGVWFFNVLLHCGFGFLVCVDVEL